MIIHTFDDARALAAPLVRREHVCLGHVSHDMCDAIDGYH